MRFIQLDRRAVACIQSQNQPDYISILHALQNLFTLGNFKFKLKIWYSGGFRLSLLEQ